MKILFLLTQDLQSPSGLGRYFPLAKGLVQLGHQVAIAALHSDFENLTSRTENRDGVEVNYVAQMHVHKRGNDKTYYGSSRLLPMMVKASVALSRETHTQKFDLIHVAKPHPMNSLAGIAGTVMRDIPLYVDFDDVEAASNRFQNRFQQRIVAGFEDWMPRLAKRITCNTFFIMERLRQHGIPDKKLFYLPNGIDKTRFDHVNPNDVEKLKSVLGLLGYPVIAYIGSLSMPAHPVHLLLEAFVFVRQAVPDAKLLIVGGGEELHNLVELSRQLCIDDVTRFVGRVPSEDAPLYYRLATVSVDPVEDDFVAKGRSPLKMFESWACGTTFVSSDVGDRRRLAGVPPAAELASDTSPSALAGAIIKVLQDPILANNIRQNGYERVKNYAWDQLSASLDLDYRQTLEGLNR